jgi:hypothetical protein
VLALLWLVCEYKRQTQTVPLYDWRKLSVPSTKLGENSCSGVTKCICLSIKIQTEMLLFCSIQLLLCRESCCARAVPPLRSSRNCGRTGRGSRRRRARWSTRRWGCRSFNNQGRFNLPPRATRNARLEIIKRERVYSSLQLTATAGYQSAPIAAWPGVAVRARASLKVAICFFCALNFPAQEALVFKSAGTSTTHAGHNCSANA